MEYSYYSLSDADLTEISNKVKDAVLANIKAEGLLTQEQVNSYLSSHFITVARKSHLFPWWKKKAPKKENAIIYVGKLAYEEDNEEVKDG